MLGSARHLSSEYVYVDDQRWRGVGLARASLPVVEELRGECQALRALKAGRSWRGEAPAGSVLAVMSTSHAACRRR